MELNLIGQTLGKYRILEEIGRGGMGVVYKAHDTMLDRLVAIKVLAPHFTWDQEFVQRFLHEARTAARLEHPHIVTIYDVIQTQGYYFIVMKYLDGCSLAEIIRREGPLPMERAARLLVQIAQALDHAHAGGLIHRDVKPANVIVSPQDHATLTDFGVAKALAGTQLTRSGTMLGTPAYMAPEQVRGQPLGPATDVYALGVVAYEMLGGRPPFEGDTAHVLHAHAYEEPRPLPQVNPRIPSAVGAVVQKALAKEPDERYRSAKVLAAALGQAIGLIEPGTVREPPVPIVRTSQGRRWLLFGTLAAVLLVALGLWIGHLGGEPAAPVPQGGVSRDIIVPTTPAPVTRMPTVTPSPTNTPVPSQTTKPTYTPEPPSPTPSPYTPARPSVGSYVEVVYTGRDGVSMRRSPGYKGKNDSEDIITTLFSPERYEVIDGPQVKDGLAWWKLRGLFGEGWVAEYSSKDIRLIAPSEPVPMVGHYVEVLYTGQDGVSMRRSTGYRGKNNSADIIATLFPPDRYEVIDGPQAKDGLVWWKLKGPFGEGWAAEYNNKGTRLIAPSGLSP